MSVKTNLTIELNIEIVQPEDIEEVAQNIAIKIYDALKLKLEEKFKQGTLSVKTSSHSDNQTEA